MTRMTTLLNLHLFDISDASRALTATVSLSDCYSSPHSQRTLLHLRVSLEDGSTRAKFKHFEASPRNITAVAQAIFPCLR